MESPEWWVAVIKVGAYFASALLCLSHALCDIAWSLRKRRCGEATGTRESQLATTRWSHIGAGIRTLALVLFGLASAAVAWYHIWHYMVQDRAKYDSFEVWVRDGDWFVQAYRMVTATPQQWFFSSQLLQGVGTIVVMTYVTSIRCGRIRGFSSFWLGCAVAISLSTPLLWAAVFNTPADVVLRRFYVRANMFLVVCVVASSIATMLLPLVEESYYGACLGIIHVGLIAPLAVLQWLPSAFECAPKSYAPSPDVQVTRRRLVIHGVGSLWVAATYFFLAGLALMAHLNNFIAVLTFASGTTHTMNLLTGAVCANSCQCSISGDVAAMTVLSMALFMSRTGGVSRTRGLLLALATPFASFSTTLPVYLALREISLIQRRAAVAEKLAQVAAPDANAAPAAVAAEAVAKTRMRRFSSHSDVAGPQPPLPVRLMSQKTPPPAPASQELMTRPSNPPAPEAASTVESSNASLSPADAVTSGDTTAVDDAQPAASQLRRRRVRGA